jgi:hypothetical protein
MPIVYFCQLWICFLVTSSEVCEKIDTPKNLINNTNLFVCCIKTHMEINHTLLGHKKD